MGGESKKPLLDKEDQISSASKLYHYFRAVGRVANEVPSIVHYMGGVPYVTTVIGKSFQIFDAESLNVVFISSECDTKIRGIANSGDYTACVTEDCICLFDRARLQLSIPFEDAREFKSVQIFGDRLLILTMKTLEVRVFPSLELINTITFPSHGSPATCFEHPSTYLNKVLICFEDLHYEIWNVKTGKIIFSSELLKRENSSAVMTCVASSPVVDVMAFGFSDGIVWIVDIKQDKALFHFVHKSPVISLAFRNDLGVESCQLATGLENGTISLWDLNSKELHSFWESHLQAVNSLHFVHQQPILISSSGDNSVKEWIIEGSSDPRLLRKRSGHTKPPRKIRFYGEDGNQILSAGMDRAFRSISLVKDSQSTEFSQGSIESSAKKAMMKQEELKLDPILDFDSFVTKDLKWDNVITSHIDSSVARTWRADHKTIGSHELRSGDSSKFTVAAMSACGNFAILGTESGSIDIFNVQSGLHRKNFKLTASGIKGVAISPSNQYIVYAYGNRVGSINFADGKELFSIELMEEAIYTSFHSDTELLAVVLSNFDIILVDVVGHQIVRRFRGNKAAVMDIAFSDDGRWIISATKDGIIKTWDIANSVVIDAFELSNRVPVSIALSPIMDFLAVVFEDDVAIHLYTNLSMYKPVPLNLSKNQSIISLQTNEEELLNELIELSLEPKAKWYNLFHLQSIKSSNKPTISVKATEALPFFLDGVLKNKRDENDKVVPQSEIGDLELDEKFSSLLSDENSNPEDVYNLLKKMSPSQVDFEIKSLSSNSERDLKILIRLLDIIIGQVDGRRDFELAVTFLNTFLKAHSDCIRSHPQEFSASLSQALFVLQSTWETLQGRFHDVICLTNFVREL